MVGKDGQVPPNGRAEGAGGGLVRGGQGGGTASPCEATPHCVYLTFFSVLLSVGIYLASCYSGMSAERDVLSQTKAATLQEPEAMAASHVEAPLGNWSLPQLRGAPQQEQQPPSTSTTSRRPRVPRASQCSPEPIEAQEEQARSAAGVATGPSGNAGGSCTDLDTWARRVVADELAPWNETGYTQQMMEFALDYSPRIGGSQAIWVKNGTVKGDDVWAQYMHRAVSKWPFAREDLQDFGVAAGNADWPFLAKEDPRAGPSRCGPSFCNANNGKFWDVVMPVEQRPQFGADFTEKRQAALDLAKQVPWKQRKDLAVWRGNLGCSLGCGPRGKSYFPRNHVERCTDDSKHWDPDQVGFVYGCGEDRDNKSAAWMNHYRVQLVKQGVACGGECGVNAKFPDIGGEHRAFVESYMGKGMDEWIGGFMDDHGTAMHRYVFHVGNNGYSDRSWRMFALGCTVLLVDNGWREWYFSLLKPFVHYIPIKEDASDVCEKLHWARSHPKEAEAIAERGRAFVERCFNEDLVNLYCAEMMRQLGRLWALGHKGARKGGM